MKIEKLIEEGHLLNQFRPELTSISFSVRTGSFFPDFGLFWIEFEDYEEQSFYFINLKEAAIRGQNSRLSGKLEWCLRSNLLMFIHFNILGLHNNSISSTHLMSADDRVVNYLALAII